MFDRNQSRPASIKYGESMHSIDLSYHERTTPNSSQNSKQKTGNNSNSNAKTNGNASPPGTERFHSAVPGHGVSAVNVMGPERFHSLAPGVSAAERMTTANEGSGHTPPNQNGNGSSLFHTLSKPDSPQSSLPTTPGGTIRYMVDTNSADKTKSMNVQIMTDDGKFNP